MAFKKAKGDNNLTQNLKETKEDDDEELLSDLSKDSCIDNDCKDLLYAQYDKVHRVKNKWKCTFKDAVLQLSGKEYIFEKVVAELERNW